MQQLLGAHRSCGQHDLGGDEASPALVHPRAGAFGRDLVATVGPRPDAGDGRERVHLGASSLGEVQVVLEQRVLGAMATAGHAFAALDTALAGWAGTAEERVGELNPGFAEEHANRRGNKRCGDSHFFGDSPHDLVGRRHGRVRARRRACALLGRRTVPARRASR